MEIEYFQNVKSYMARYDLFSITRLGGLVVCHLPRKQEVVSSNLTRARINFSQNYILNLHWQNESIPDKFWSLYLMPDIFGRVPL